MNGCLIQTFYCGNIELLPFRIRLVMGSEYLHSTDNALQFEDAEYPDLSMASALSSPTAS
jgi:hypothetical protein